MGSIQKPEKKAKSKESKRIKAFILHYLKSYNATQAAKDAGYSKKTAYSSGQRLLKNVEIQQAIIKAESRLENKLFISKEKILKELAVIGFSSIDDYLTIGEGGLVQANTFEEMPIGSISAIKKVKEKRTIRQIQDDSEDMILDSTFEFELYDKPQALINMGKELGMFREKVDHTVHLTLEDLVAGGE